MAKNKERNPNLEQALLTVAKACALSTRKGADYILMAVEFTEEKFKALCEDIDQTFAKSSQKQSAIRLIEALCTIHTLCRTDEEARAHATDYATGLVKAQATLDYLNGVPPKNFQKKLREEHDQGPLCRIL